MNEQNEENEEVKNPLDYIKQKAEKFYRRSAQEWREKFVSKWEKDFGRYYEAALIINDLMEKRTKLPDPEVVEYVYAWAELLKLQMMISQVYYKKAKGLKLGGVDFVVENACEKLAVLPLPEIKIAESLVKEIEEFYSSYPLSDGEFGDENDKRQN